MCSWHASEGEEDADDAEEVGEDGAIVIDSAASEEDVEEQTQKKRQPAQRKAPANQRAKSNQKAQAAKQPTRRQPRRQAAASTFEEDPASSGDDASGTDPFLSPNLRLPSCTCPQGICIMFRGPPTARSKDNAFGALLPVSFRWP